MKQEGPPWASPRFYTPVKAGRQGNGDRQTTGNGGTQSQRLRLGETPARSFGCTANRWKRRDAKPEATAYSRFCG